MDTAHPNLGNVAMRNSIDRSYLNAKKYAILNATRRQSLTIMKTESGADWRRLHAGRDDKLEIKFARPK